MRSLAQREIALLIGKIRRIASVAVNRQLQLIGSSASEYRVLLRLSHEAELSQHDLAQDTAMDPAAISRLLRDMEAEGLVELRTHPKDKRQRVARLTRAGRKKESILSPTVDSALAPIAGSLSASEEKHLLQLLRKVGAAAEVWLEQVD